MSLLYCPKPYHAGCLQFHTVFQWTGLLRRCTDTNINRILQNSWPHTNLSNYNVFPVFTSHHDLKLRFLFEMIIYLIWQEFSYPDWILSALGSREGQSIWVQFSGLNTQRTTDEDWLKNSTADSGLLSVSVWSSYNLMWVSSSVFSCDYFSLGDLRTTLFLPVFW